MRTTKVTLHRYRGPTAGPQTFQVLARTTGAYLGMVHYYPGNATLGLAPCWMATHGAGLHAFAPEAFRASLAFAAGLGQRAGDR